MVIRPNSSIEPFVLGEHDGFEYLAVVQNGMQIGALAQTPDGRYVQVNGDVVQPLNEYKVLRALKRALPRQERRRKPAPPAAAPVVSVRRRRRVPVHGPA